MLGDDRVAFEQVLKNQSQKRRRVVTTCLYHQRNNTWLQEDLKSLFSCSTLYRVDNRREIGYLRSPMYYSLCVTRTT